MSVIHVDINAAYVSMMRVFDPSLEGVPAVMACVRLISVWLIENPLANDFPSGRGSKRRRVVTEPIDSVVGGMASGTDWRALWRF